MEGKISDIHPELTSMVCSCLTAPDISSNLAGFTSVIHPVRGIPKHGMPHEVCNAEWYAVRCLSQLWCTALAKVIPALFLLTLLTLNLLPEACNGACNDMIISHASVPATRGQAGAFEALQLRGQNVVLSDSLQYIVIQMADAHSSGNKAKTRRAGDEQHRMNAGCRCRLSSSGSPEAPGSGGDVPCDRHDKTQ